MTDVARQVWACLECGLFNGERPARCPTCGAETWDVEGKDRSFVHDYVRTRRSRRHTRAIAPAMLAAIVPQAVVMAWSMGDGSMSNSPLVLLAFAGAVFVVVDRVQLARMTPARRRLETAFRSPPLAPRIATGTPVLLFALFSVVFALEQTDALGPTILRGLMVPAKIRAGQALWTLLTSMALHASYAHLAGNSYVMLLGGIRLDLRVGRLACLAIFVASGLAGGLAEALLSTRVHDSVLGASGGIMGMYAAASVLDYFASREPDQRRASLGRVVLTLFLVLALSWIDAGTQDNVAWRAHLGGFATGFVFAFALRRHPVPDDVARFDAALR
jgi:membrane associated rhomboid family serine protease